MDAKTETNPKGAGRKPLPPQEKRELYEVFLTPAEAGLVCLYGTQRGKKGNVSQGVQALLDVVEDQKLEIEHLRFALGNVVDPPDCEIIPAASVTTDAG